MHRVNLNNNIRKINHLVIMETQVLLQLEDQSLNLVIIIQVTFRQEPIYGVFKILQTSQI